MTSRRGRCNNVELCSMATTQRVIEIPQSEPFICPRCSSELSPFTARKSNTAMRAVQIGAIALAVSCIGYSVYVQNLKPQPAPARREVAASSGAAMSVVPSAQAAVVVQPSPPLAPRPFLRLLAQDKAAASLLARLAASYLAASGDTDIHTQAGSQPGAIIVSGLQDGRAEAIAVAADSHASTPSAEGAGLALIMTEIGSARHTQAGADTQHVVGVDAMAVVVSPAITLASLSMAQLQDILGGKLKNWSELGAQAADIHAYIVPGLDDQAEAAHVGSGGAAVLAAISHDTGGIGLVRADEAGSAHVLPVGDTGAAIAPTEAAVASEDYPLTRRAVFVLPADRADMASQRFLAFAQSSSAQTALAAAGFVPLAIHAEPIAKAPAAPDPLGQYTDGARPLSVVFHFDPNVVSVGRSNMRDVEKLAAYMRAHHVDGAKLLLAGFADDTGTPADKEAASQKRAAAVAAALARFGIKPAGVQGFGSEAPVAGNATAEGRDRNRRVEAYLAP